MVSTKQGHGGDDEGGLELDSEVIEVLGAWWCQNGSIGCNQRSKHDVDSTPAC